MKSLRTLTQRVARRPERDDDAPRPGAPLGGTNAQAMQRLQIGLAGLGSMVLLVGLASVLGKQADLAEERAVPEAAPTTEPSDAAPQRDPLADAGIVPDLPTDSDETPAPTEGAPVQPGGEGGTANGDRED